MSKRFFLGANTPAGFSSFYDEFIDTANTDSMYIIKSSPGSGKSGFMKRIADGVGDSGAEYIHCSGDPASLDGLWFPERRIAFVDGTAPHVVEPSCHTAVESYLHLGKFVDREGVLDKKADIMRLTSEHKIAYSRVYRCLSAIRSLDDDALSLVLDHTALLKIATRAHGIIKREIKKSGGGKLHRRYLNALTPEGEVVFWETVDSLAERVYVIENQYGLSPFMLSPILNAALEAGQEVYACYNPLCSEARLEHLIFPDLSLAFVSVTPSRRYPGKSYRHIRLDAAIPLELLRKNRQRLRLIHKTRDSILKETHNSLAEAKLIHDQIEACYTPHVDFDGETALAETMIKNMA